METTGLSVTIIVVVLGIFYAVTNGYWYVPVGILAFMAVVAALIYIFSPTPPYGKRKRRPSTLKPQ
jgi:hypothetical protein